MSTPNVGRPALASVFLVAGMLVWGATAEAAAARGWPTKQEGGYIVVDTPHYQIKTDHDIDTAQLLASHQEAFFIELYKRLGGGKPASQVMRLQIYLFKTKEKYLEVVGDAGKGTQGLFSKERISAWGPVDRLDQVMGTFRHEGTHQFVDTFIGYKCPIWLNEGLAEFFQHATFINGQLEVGQVPVVAVNVLKKAAKDGKLIPLSKMLNLTVVEWNAAVRAENDAGYIQYYEAWSIVHFLQGADNGKYRAPLLQFIYYLSRNRAPDDAWEKTFGGGVAAFDKRWRDYIENLKPTIGLACRVKLGLLGECVLGAKPEALADMETFREAVVKSKAGWTITWGDGTPMEIKGEADLRDLFHCPEDKKSAADAISYEFGPPAKEGERPVIRCRHHTGIVLETSYQEDKKTGGWSTDVVTRPALPAGKTGPAADKKTPAAGEKKTPATTPEKKPAAGAAKSAPGGATVE